MAFVKFGSAIDSVLKGLIEFLSVHYILLVRFVNFMKIHTVKPYFAWWRKLKFLSVFSTFFARLL
jgi:hypothetical protein